MGLKHVRKERRKSNWTAFEITLSLSSTHPRNERGRVDTHDHLVTFLSTSISGLNSVDTKRAMDFFCVLRFSNRAIIRTPCSSPAQGSPALISVLYLDLNKAMGSTPAIKIASWQKMPYSLNSLIGITPIVNYQLNCNCPSEQVIFAQQPCQCQPGEA